MYQMLRKSQAESFQGSISPNPPKLCLCIPVILNECPLGRSEGPLLVCQKCVVFVCSFNALLTGVHVYPMRHQLPRLRNSRIFALVHGNARSLSEKSGASVKNTLYGRVRFVCAPCLVFVRFCSLESLKRKNYCIAVYQLSRVRVKDCWRFDCITIAMFFFLSIILLFAFIREK